MTANETADNLHMSDITVVEFETSSLSSQTYVSELADGPPYTVHGIALGADDVTVGQSGIKKKWPADELARAAESLKGTNLVEDHENSARGVVGRVTKAGYKDDTGVVYEAELYDDDLAEKVQNGLLEVSIRGYHADVDSLEEDDDTGAKVVEDIEFDNLSIVPSGAAPSNTLEMGEHAELSAAELSTFTDTLDRASLQEIEPGMWVKWGDNRGITISQVEDGEIEVDIYEERDGQWRSTEETKMVSTGDLSEWDVDEDNIGPAKDSDDEEDSESDEEENAELASKGDKVQWQDGKAQGVVRERKTDGCFSDKIDGDQEICASDDEAVVLIEIVKEGEATGEMVAHKEGSVNEADFEMSSAELEQFSDYPEAASENAQMALDAREETGNPNDCGTQTGWTRANQLADGEALSEEVVGKMAAFNRHRSNSDMDDDEGKADCGWMMWKAWGGDEGVDWAKRKMESIEENAAEELEPASGDFVRWKGVNDEPQFGQIVSINQDGQQMVAEIRRHTKGGEALDEIVEKPIQGLETWDRSPESDTPDDMRDDSQGIEAPTWEDGQMVKWQVNPAMKGKIVHVDRDKKVLMVEVMEETEQGLQPTGFTLTAGYQDVVPMDAESAAVSTRDVPTQDSEPEHDTESMDSLLERFIEERGSNKTLKDFIDWMQEENLAVERGEGEEEVLDSQAKRDESHEGEPHRYIDAEDEASELAMEDVPDKHIFKSREDAVDKAEDLGLSGAHEMDGRWMPGETHEEYMDNVSSNAKHGDSDDEEEEDSEDMAKHHHEASMEMLDEFLSQEGNDMETFVSAFLEWADDDNARQAVDEFTAEEGNSLETGVGEFQSWLETKVDEAESSGHTDDLDDSANEGNSSDAEELQELEVHTPDFSGTTDSDWSKPALEDFGEDPDLSDVADHFVVSKVGFPPENYGDLALPVVEPNGDLNLNALQNAKARGSQVEGLSGEDLDRAMSIINTLANENFDADFEEAADENIDGTAGRSTPGEPMGSGVRVLSGDDLRQGYKSEESDADSLTTYKVTMTENIEEKLSGLDDPVAVEASEVDELREKADRFEEMSENLEALRERTDILDDVDRSQVEELAESDEAVVVESARYEELQSEAEQVAGVYAASLAEEYAAFSAEELTDKFSIEELREKFEEQIGDVEEELASSEDAEPRSQDADEESLEDASEESEDEQSEEELSDSAAEKQAELKDKILGGR